MKLNKLLVVIVILVTFLVGCGNNSSLPVPTSTSKPTPISMLGTDESIVIDGVEIRITKVSYSMEPNQEFDTYIWVEGKVIKGDLSKIGIWGGNARLYWTTSNIQEDSIQCTVAGLKEDNSFFFIFGSNTNFNINSTDWEIELSGIVISLDLFEPLQKLVP